MLNGAQGWDIQKKEENIASRIGVRTMNTPI
jgi:hypothetical protein